MCGAKFFQIFFVSLLWSRRAIAKVAYSCAFSEDVKDCPNFKNNHIDANQLKMKGDDGLGLTGTMELYAPIEAGYEICVKARKITEVGYILVFNTCGDICSTLQDTNSPWYTLFNAVNITGCPIEPKKYHFDDIRLDLAFASDVLGYEFCADYLITMTVMKGFSKTACHQMIVTVFEYELDE